jgi:hypothetical protein
MAGTLLLIAKNRRAQQVFRNYKKILQEFHSLFFEDYFLEIKYSLPDPSCLLVEYRQNKKNRFYSSDNGWLTFEGTVFSLNETKSLQADDLFKMYLEMGDKIFSQLDGTYVIKLYDARTRKHKVINDFIKNKTNYTCQSNDFILFTPYLATAALITKPEIDAHALNEFMWRYYILSFRTILKDAERLQPASVYTVSESKLDINTYWQWPKNYSQLNFENSVEKMVDSMKESARLINNEFGSCCIDFTMGQDSRQVISSFTSQNLQIKTSTFGSSDFYEVKRVKEMAERHNIPNINVQLEDDYYNNIWAIFKKAVMLGSCEQPGYLLGRILYLKGRYKEWANVSLNGVDGHFYKNGLWDEQYLLNLYRQPKDFNISLFLKLRALSKRYPDNLFSDPFLKIKTDSNDYFSKIIKESLNDYLNAPVSMQIDKFDLTHWLNFALAANSATNSVIAHLSPLLLRRNLEFALQIPVKWKFNLSKFQRAVVFALDKELAREKTDFGGVNMIPKNIITYPGFYFKYFYFQSARFRKKIKSKLGFKTVTHLQEAWDYLSVYKELYKTPEMQSLLFDDNNFNPYLNQKGWQDINQNLKDEKFQTMDNFELCFKIAGIEYFMKSSLELWNRSLINN